MNFWNSSVFRDIAQLTFGTVLGRVILLAAMPLVTRLYSPNDFALLAVFMAITNTVAVVSCLRLDLAIPLADSESDAAALLCLAAFFSTTISAIVLLVSLLIPSEIAILIGNPEISKYLWVTSLSVVFISSYSIFQFWATRARRFHSISKTRIGQSGVGAATMLLLGWLGLAPFGLMLGNILAIGAGGLSLAAQAFRLDREKFRSVSLGKMVKTLRLYHRFPVFSTPEALANVAGFQVPILIIAAFGNNEAGQLFLAMQIMAAPMTLLGTSVSQVYASRVREELRLGQLASFTRKMMGRLFLIGLGPMVMAALLAPSIFPWIFGSEWARSGTIISLIAPWMLMQLTVSPVAVALHVTNNQWKAMILQIFGVFLRPGLVYFLGSVPSIGYVEAFAISGIVFYFVYAGVVLSVVRSR